MVELLDGADQADGAFLHEIVIGRSSPAIPLCDRVHEPQVALDHLSLGGEVTALDALGELDLLGRREEAVVAAAISRHRREHRTQRTGAGLRAPDELIERGRRGLVAPEQRELDAADRMMARAVTPLIAASGVVVSARASPAATAASIAGPGPPRSSAAVTPSAARVSATAGHSRRRHGAR